MPAANGFLDALRAVCRSLLPFFIVIVSLSFVVKSEELIRGARSMSLFAPSLGGEREKKW